MAIKNYYSENKDEINSVIMELASELAVLRLMQTHDKPFDRFIEPTDPDKPELGTQYKEKYQAEYDKYYDYEYERIASLMKFDFSHDTGLYVDIRWEPKFADKITELRNDILESIKAIMHINDMDEISLADVCDKPVMIWRSNIGWLYEGTVIIVKVIRDKLVFVVDNDVVGEIQLNESSCSSAPLFILDDIRSGIIEALEDTYDRVCHQCGKVMHQGYCVENGTEYYCSDECLHKNYTPEQWQAMCEDKNSDNYYTEWPLEE